MTLSIVGRSSSHFTRVVRMFAHELGIEYTFQLVADLNSTQLDDYAANPALRIPVLQTPEGPWFGALHICRELARRTHVVPKIIWPEQLHDRIAANAQELVLQGMGTEVALIMQAAGGAIPTSGKAFTSLTNILRWLDANLPNVRASTSELSFLELTAYCFVAHLPFRKVLDVSEYRALQAFCEEFGQRPSARATRYRFDFSS
ncbi:MAG TPA: glutathione S-transferase family protein [Polyangiales bacterium]|nr:glutathione S-transferase family protein [Polyangiales bacterium]